ncbi:MAG: 1,4-alpha-glucan-branching protein [Bacteroidetes bacterium]|nr:1,4-alpha-glucan-branching protein [Bacteroidota bacterium]MBS1669961.1 1,4-alpha-glucan-branching protein [Bacteroidota bacterium]
MRFILTIIFGCCLLQVNAQLLNWSPTFIQETSSTITITADATKGNQGLNNYTPVTDVYVHIGVITSLSSSASDWKYVPAYCVWGTNNTLAQCTSAGANQWKFTITGGLRSFFGITNSSEKILKIAILFRNGAGTKKLANTDGSDMYIPVYDNGLYVRIDNPLRQPNYILSPETITKNLTDNINITANASQSSTLKIYFNGTQINTASSASTISANTTITTIGTQQIIAESNNGTIVSRDTVSFLVSGGTNIAALPPNVKDGINYESGDTSVTLVLYAPNKNKISVIGDFNNWAETLATQMNKTPDGSRFWVRITGLTPGTEYAYQYYIDNSLKVADYNTEKILDPYNDSYIPSSTYPSLKAYPAGKATGIVSILQTAKPTYTWTATSYTRPNKKNLVIYELLVRDFVAAHNFQTLKDTLTYLKRLGVNAIEIMPFSEFEGNISWGYNPNFFFAPDKYYGTETAVKQFIDECHKQGMAVIMDLVMNHCMNSAPQAQMYWDTANNRPAANNPWLNVTATHPYNVGNDFNHEAQATKDLVARVVRHWLTNYKLDGFRWDLSKGFTQTNNPTDVNAWSAYDASRIAIWKRIYDTMQAVSLNSICILEHFAANSEEIELSNYGMLLWGNSNYSFNQSTMGYASGSDISDGISKNRGWTNPFLVTYQESHDEERLMYKNINYGNSNGSYNIKDTVTALNRNAMATAFWAMIPGPKMLWQFGELGYHYSINTCADLSINTNCRTDAKPIRWDFYNNTNRKALFDVYTKLIKLKLTPNYFTAFTTNNVTWNTSGLFKSLILNDDSLKVVVIGNFDVTPQTGSVTFPTSGIYYSYLGNTSRTATGSAENITLQPGEYYVYTNRNINNSVVTAINNTPSTTENNIQLNITPNLIYNNANIQYTIPQSGNVTISIKNFNGNNIATLVNSFKPKGTQTISLNTNGFAAQTLSSGLYLLELTINGIKKTEKFMIAK